MSLAMLSVFGIPACILVMLYLVLGSARRRATPSLTSLHMSEEHCRLVQERARDLIALIDERGCICYASPYFHSMLGHDPALLVGRTAFDQIHPDDVAETIAHFAHVCRYSTGLACFRLRHANGTWRWIEAHAVRMIDCDQPVVVIVAHDITERKQLELQLLQLQKLETIGCLASGVVHDLNNLLMSIASFAEVGRYTLPPQHPVHNELDQIIKGAARAATLTGGLLAFARKQTPAPCLLDLNVLLFEMDRLLRHLIGPHITLNLQPGPDLWQIKANPSHLEQVLLNLVVNARDAMPNGGALTITTRNIRLERTSTHSYTDDITSEHVLLMVSDTGVGMDEATKAQLFEPFFTTKAQGTGLGLSTCKSIITQHDGVMRVSSVPGEGTSVYIYLPRAAEDTI